MSENAEPKESFATRQHDIIIFSLIMGIICVVSYGYVCFLIGFITHFDNTRWSLVKADPHILVDGCQSHTGWISFVWCCTTRLLQLGWDLITLGHRALGSIWIHTGVIFNIIR